MGGHTTILAWNILHGGGPVRTAEIGLAILERNPDVVVLSEFRAARGGQLRAQLADHGLCHQVTTRVREGRNGILIASRHAMEILPEPGPVPGRWLAVEVDDLGLTLAGVHGPDDTTPGLKAAYWQFLVDFGRQHRMKKTLLVGDVNSGRRQQDGPRFGCEALLGTLISLGFVDVWRRDHPDAREASWVSALGSARLDAAYVSVPLADRLAAARFDHAPREAGLSDHSVLLLDLRVSAAGSQPAVNGLFSR